MLRRINATYEPIDDLLGLYLGEERRAGDRPWLMLNFVSSIDGGTAFEGKSSRLGDDDDRELFLTLRAVPDVILVGAGTVAAEDYGPVVLDEKRRGRRLEAGLSEVPVLAIVSGRLSFDPEARVFSDPEHRPLVITGPDAEPAKLALLGDAADVVILEEVTPAAILARLGAASVILCEGGPSLAGQFASEGLVDELHLTLAPKMISGRSARIAYGPPVEAPLEMALDRALIGDRSLFLRYLRA
ncbi:MAG TPA: dihydrofolate reductase family protein [Acidimicrobiia bacterium]|nr:dihydrofolate reductase family protein [Acidimicrobiia bacterium]